VTHRAALLVALIAGMSGCAGADKRADFENAEKSPPKPLMSEEARKLFEPPKEEEYRLLQGDAIRVEVWGKPEAGIKSVVGPDGRIGVPIAGTVMVGGETRDAAAKKIEQALSPYYPEPRVTVYVERYSGNKVVVLGRVKNPGVVHFESQPTLLEAIARAGSLPVHDKQATLSRCAVFRGKDRVIWVDLRELLQSGNLSLNIRLKANDVVYLPDSDETLVYVLGEVHRPGAYRLTPSMSFLDALSQAGGPTRDAKTGKIQLVRSDGRLSRTVDFSDILAARPGVNASLSVGDIVYVPSNSLAKAGYVMEKISPALNMMILGHSLAR
jgi:polysaccharide export outer membrane protein